MAKIELSGKPICITGGSSGIGRATAIACARAGMPVALLARHDEKLREVVAEIEAIGGRAIAIAGDVCEVEDCERLAARCAEAFGGVYVVFANAGYGQESAVMEMDDADVRTMFEVNFFGTLNTVRAALPYLRKKGAGHVIVCSSCVARFALPFFSVYSATKAAQHHVSRAMRLELEPEGIHVSSVHPVGTKTAFFETTRSHSGGTEYSLVDHTSERFMQTPNKVARAVVRCLRRPKPEVWTSFFVRYGMVIAGATPRMADRGVRWMVKRRRELDTQGKGTGARDLESENGDQGLGGV